MGRVSGQPSHFIITVHPDHDQEKPRRFRTKGIIPSFGAEPLRGTRVFEAIENDNQGCEKGSNVILKDTWTDKDRVREGAILAQMYHEAKGGDKALVQKHFLTIICHGDVRMNPEVVDDTEETIMRGLKTMNHTFLVRYAKTGSITISDSLSETLEMNSFDDPNPKTYIHKTHYRIVFKEQGIAINHIPHFYGILDTF